MVYICGTDEKIKVVVSKKLFSTSLDTYIYTYVSTKGYFSIILIGIIKDAI